MEAATSPSFTERMNCRYRSSVPNADDESARKTERAADSRGPRVRAFRVEVTEGPAKGTKTFSRDGELHIGAGPGNDLVIDDPQVSSHHLEIEATAEGGV